MKRVLVALSLVLSVQFSFAQTAADTITTADMPVSGDTLRFSNASPAISATALTLINDTGANISWDFSYLVPISQGIDSYLTAAQANPLFALTVPSGAYGYKVLDSIALPLPGTPITLKGIYTFFKKNTSANSFQAISYAVSSLFTAFNYSTPDTWYFFPLAYGNPRDSSDYSLTMSIPTLGTIKRNGYRLTTVTGWGTVKTPYYTTPQNCILVKSEIHEIDSVFITTPIALSLGIPQNTIEYKWLIQGEHYPAVWITTPYPDTTAPIITSITFRDVYRDSLHIPPATVANVTNNIIVIEAYPNPSENGLVNLDIPATWKNFTVEVFDMNGKLVNTSNNKHQLDLSMLSGGLYLGRVTSGNNTAYVRIAR